MYSSYSSSAYDTAGLEVALGAFYTVYVVCCLVVGIFSIVCLWRIFAKAGRPGWGSIIPIYNLYLLFDIAFGSGIKFLFLFIPIVNVVFGIMCYVKLAEAFGKGAGFAVGMIFLYPIFSAILAFDKSVYLGPK